MTHPTYRWVGTISNEAKTYLEEKVIPRALKLLTEVSKIYANELKYDISSQVGISKVCKEKLITIKDQGLISENSFKLVKSLRFNQSKADEEEKQMKNEEEDKEDKKNKRKEKDQYKYDEIDHYDKKKQTMGLLKEGYKTKEKDKEPAYNYNRHHRP